MRIHRTPHSSWLRLAMAAVLFGGWAWMAPHALAESRTVQAGGKVKNDTGSDKTDYHIKVSSDTNMTFESARQGPFPVINISGNGTRMVSFDFSGATVENGKEVTITVHLKQEEKNDIEVETKWTPPGSPDETPMTGFQIDAKGNYTITNSYEWEIEISNLTVEVEVPFRSDDELFAHLEDFGAEFGEVELAVPAHGEVFVGNFPHPPGSFVYGTFNARFTPEPGAPQSTAIVVHGHEGITETTPTDERAVPALTTVGAVVLLVLLLATMLWIVRRRSAR